ncbi:MAG TPA: hypothetical protein VLI91_07355 [Roseiarcus sp.]|nr:hypothetical protein [Roseiarcus sp.]
MGDNIATYPTVPSDIIAFEARRPFALAPRRVHPYIGLSPLRNEDMSADD